MKFINDYLAGVEQDILRAKALVRKEEYYITKQEVKVVKAKNDFETCKAKYLLDKHKTVLTEKQEEYKKALAKRPNKELKKIFDDVRALEIQNEAINAMYRELNKGKAPDEIVSKTPEEALCGYKLEKFNMLSDFCWSPAMGDSFVVIANGILNAKTDISLDNHMKSMFRLYL